MPAYPFFLLSESHDPTSRRRGIGAVRWFRVNGNRSGEIPNLSKAQAALSDSIFWRSNVYTPEAPRKTAFCRSGIRTGRTMNIPSRNIRNRVFNIGLTLQIYEKNSPPPQIFNIFFLLSRKNIEASGRLPQKKSEVRQTIALEPVLKPNSLENGTTESGRISGTKSRSDNRPDRIPADSGSVL